MDLRDTYIWLDEIRDKCKNDLIDEEIEAIEMCKLLIKEKVTKYADNRVK